MTVFNMFTNHIDRAINKINAEGEAIDLDIEFNQDLKIITMRPNQKYVYETYPNEQYFNMIEPMGAGKSMTLKYLCTKLLEDNKDLKVIIIVPRTLIANTFKKETLEYPDGTIRKWDIGKNLCDDHHDKLKLLKTFLKKTKFPKGIHSRVCVTTHSAIARFADEIGDIGNLFNNTLVIIDEAHHVLSAEYDHIETSNKIGSLVCKILERNHKSTSLWLVSATLFRGDRGNIIPPSMINMFTEHFLPFDQHWKENIKYIETFEYNFVIYDDIFKDIQTIIKENKKKTIIFCPYNGHLLKGSDKFQFRDDLKHKIKEVWPDYKYLDLIDPNDRESRKKELELDKDAELIDVIYALKLFDEGTDWKFASQAIDAAPRDSLGLQIQKLGRILRDLKGKKHVAYNILFPHQSVFKTEVDRVDHLKKMFAVLAGALILREAIQPLPYPELPEPREVSPFEAAVSSPTIRKDIIQKISEELVCYADENHNPTPTETREKIKEILKDEYNVEDDEDYSITTHIGLMLKRLEQTVSQTVNKKPQPNWEPSIDLSGMVKAGFDKIFEKSIYNTLLTFGTAAAGVETFDEFRRIYKNHRTRKTPDQWVQIAEDLSKNNYGYLQHNNWLILNDYAALVQCKYQHPKKFAHIKQHKKKLTGKELVEIAEKLVKDNNGILYSDSDLTQLFDLSNLVTYKERHPEKFAHIKQHKKRRTPDESVIFAEELAKGNNGSLDIPRLREDHPALVSCICRHPKKFAHIPQIRGCGVPKNERYNHYRTIAKNLASSHDGVIPCYTWLSVNNFGFLNAIIEKYPEIFKDLLQFYGVANTIRIIGQNKTIEGPNVEYPKICDALIVKFGAIPNTQQLRVTYQLGPVYHHMVENPHLYKGKPQYYGYNNKIRIIGE